MKNRTKVNSLVLICIMLINSTMLGQSSIVPEQELQHTEINSEDKNVEAVNDIRNNIGNDRMNIIEIEEVKKDYIEIQVELTFYTSLASCNGRWAGLTASGKKLNSKTVAVPRKLNSIRPIFPFETRIFIDGIGERIVEDTGNPNYIKIKENGVCILDVYVIRNKGESDSQYKKRVVQMGRIQSTAKVYLLESGE